MYLLNESDTINIYYFVMRKKEVSVMLQIHLNKDLLRKEIFTDVMFIVFSSPTAMGNGGMVRFIIRDGTEYFFNFLEDDLKCSQVEEFFPPLKQFKRDSVALEDWHLVYLGVGTSIAIKDEVFPTFKHFAQEYPTKNYKLFQNWRKVVYLTIKGE